MEKWDASLGTLNAKILQIQQDHKSDPQSIAVREIKERVELTSTRRPKSMSKSMHQLEFNRLRNQGSNSNIGMEGSVRQFQVKITKELFEEKKRKQLAVKKQHEDDSPAFKRNTNIKATSKVVTVRNRTQATTTSDDNKFRHTVKNSTVSKAGEHSLQKQDSITSRDEMIRNLHLDGQQSLSSTSYELSSRQLLSTNLQRTKDFMREADNLFASGQSTTKSVQQLAKVEEKNRRLQALEKAKQSLLNYHTKKETSGGRDQDSNESIKYGRSGRRNRGQQLRHNTMMSRSSHTQGSIFDDGSNQETVDELKRQNTNHLNIQNLASDSSEDTDSDESYDANNPIFNPVQKPRSKFYKESKDKKGEKNIERMKISAFDTEQRITPSLPQDIHKKQPNDDQSTGIFAVNQFDSFKKQENKATFTIKSAKPSSQFSLRINKIKTDLTQVPEKNTKGGSEKDEDESNHCFITEPNSGDISSNLGTFQLASKIAQSPRENFPPQAPFPETVVEENSLEDIKTIVTNTPQRQRINFQNSPRNSKIVTNYQSASVSKLVTERQSQTARGGTRLKMSRLGPRPTQQERIVTPRRGLQNYRMNVDYSKLSHRDPVLRSNMTSTRASERQLPSHIGGFPFSPSSASGMPHILTAFSPISTGTDASRRELLKKNYVRNKAREFQKEKNKICKLLDPKKPMPNELVEMLVPSAEHPLTDLPLNKLKKIAEGIMNGVNIPKVLATETDKPFTNSNEYLLSRHAIKNQEQHYQKRLQQQAQYPRSEKLFELVDRKRRGHTPLAITYPNLHAKFEAEKGKSPTGLINPDPKTWFYRKCSNLCTEYFEGTYDELIAKTDDSHLTAPYNKKNGGRAPSTGPGEKVVKVGGKVSDSDHSHFDSISQSSAGLSSIGMFKKGERRNTKSKSKRMLRQSTSFYPKNKTDKTTNQSDKEDLFKEDKMLKSDPIMLSDLLYRHVLLAGIKSAKELFLHNEKAECQQVMFDLLKISKQAFDMQSALRLHLCIAETWVSRADKREQQKMPESHNKKQKDGLQEAIKNCQVVLLMNERLSMCELDNEALRITYTCLMKQGKFKEARCSLKMCLERSWLTNNTDWELHVYEKLGLCHFYEGNMDKAEFYMMRCELGQIEPQGTETRAVYLNIRNNYKLSKVDRFSANPAELKKTIFDEFYDHFTAAFNIMSARKERERILQQKTEYAMGTVQNKEKTLEEKLREATEQLIKLESGQDEQQKGGKGQMSNRLFASIAPALVGKALTAEEIMHVPLEEEIQKWPQKDEIYQRLSSFCDQIVQIRDAITNASFSPFYKYIGAEVQDELSAAREQMMRLERLSRLQQHEETSLKQENNDQTTLAKAKVNIKVKRELHIPLEVVIDNPMQELPSPTDERTGDEIIHLFSRKKIKAPEFVSAELLDIVPHLFTAFLQKEEVFKTSHLDYRNALKRSYEMEDVIERFKKKRTGESRPNVYLSHLSPCFHERYVSNKGKIKIVKQEKTLDEKEKKTYETKHFIEFEKILMRQIERIKKHLTSFTPIIQSPGIRVAIYGAKKMHELMRDRRMKFTNLAAKREAKVRKKGQRRPGIVAQKLFNNRKTRLAIGVSESGSQISGDQRSIGATENGGLSETGSNVDTINSRSPQREKPIKPDIHYHEKKLRAGINSCKTSTRNMIKVSSAMEVKTPMIPKAPGHLIVEEESGTIKRMAPKRSLIQSQQRTRPTSPIIITTGI